MILIADLADWAAIKRTQLRGLDGIAS